MMAFIEKKKIVSVDEKSRVGQSRDMLFSILYSTFFFPIFLSGLFRTNNKSNKKCWVVAQLPFLGMNDVKDK